VVDKTRMDAFHNTDLEVLLRRIGRPRLVVTGIVTNACVRVRSPSSTRMKKAQFRCAFRMLGLLRLVTVEAFGHAWACAFASSIQVWHSCSDRPTTAPCRVLIISLR
jgi:hypothetical protein